MLVFTRKINEVIKLEDKISITVLGLTRRQARLGIDAPKNISIFREEIYQKIQEKKKQNSLKT